MNWKAKAFLQRGFSAIPRGESLNYLFQRYVTKSLPNSAATMRRVVDTVREDFGLLKGFLSAPLETARFYEFGAGVTLAGPLAFYCLGVERQTVVDIRWLLRPELVNHTIKLLGELQFDPPFARKALYFLKDTERHKVTGELKEAYGIEYRAPCDARQSGIEPRSIDVITSSAVLEHVPPSEIKPILAECHRLLSDRGVAAFRIDYQDHYSYFDPNVSVYNFLRYSDEEWVRYSPALNYMNRLRHRDYLDLFRAAGFEILAENAYEIRDVDLVSIRGLPLGHRFKSYTEKELAVRGAYTVLRKQSHP